MEKEHQGKRSRLSVWRSRQRGRLERKRIAEGVARPIHECEQTRTRVGKIDRGSEYKPVCSAGLLCKDEYLVCLNAFFAKRTHNLGECCISTI